MALAALLLGMNNVVKTIAYQRSLPWKASAGIALVVAIGAAAGARLLTATTDTVVSVAVVAGISLTFVAERVGRVVLRRLGAPALALAAGLTSGFSGTAGPLKGVAIRSLRMSRWLWDFGDGPTSVQAA